MAYQLNAVFNLGGNYIKQMQIAQKETSGMNKSLATVGGGFSKLASIALKAGAVVGLGLGLKDMVTKASAGQQKLAQLDAVLKSTGGSAGMTQSALLKLADAQSKVTTFSKGTTMAAESLLLTFTGISSKTFPSTIKAAQDMSTAMGTDLNSSVMLLGKSLNNPAEGMGRLAKSGVTFTKQQKEQITTLQKSGKTMEAQKIILAELSKEFGGSATAKAKTFAGQMTILKNSMSGVESSLGMILIPYLTKFATTVNKYVPKIKEVLVGMIDFVVPKFKTFTTLVGQIAQELLPDFGKSAGDAKTKASDLAKGGINFIITALTWIRDNMGAVKLAIAGVTTVWVIQSGIALILNGRLAVNNALSAIAIVKDGALTVAIIALYVAQGIQTLATGAGSVAMGIFNTVMGLNPIVKVIGLVVLLGLAIYGIITHWKSISTWISTTWKKLMDNPVAKFILMMNPFTAILVVIYDNFDKITSAISKAWNWLTKWNGTDVKDKTSTVTTKYVSTEEKNASVKATGNLNAYTGNTLGINPLTGRPYAGGTIYATKGAHLVGEKGAEIVNFKGGETVDTASNTKKILGANSGQPFIINNYFSNVVGEESFFQLCSEKVSQKILTQLENM
ncbi:MULTISPECIES: phage tail tape measure protein [Clostridium]|uniref:Phage tail length tape measure family protein n=1 Tax=Clostridium frigoriphilum TaxID=443253 RepID=A0ABU7UU72_9CLOT|nr:phage tail length tape measure family protein [Clostridium sp. DSM 17811]MBU3098747.1 phage tail length tape measure family protein [Clostridium sp. DSM 17811]